MGGTERVVIDSNVWVSGFIRPDGPPGRILELIGAGEIRPVVTGALAAELVEVASRERLLRRFVLSNDNIRELLRTVEEVAVDIELDPPLRDPNDLPVIEAAVLGRTKTIISGDLDLVGDPAILRWLSDRGIDVLTPAAFLAARLEERF